LRRVGAGLARATQDLRRAIDANDWSQVHTLADRAARDSARLATSEATLELADAVYGPRLFQCEPAALSMSGVLVRPAAALESTRAAIILHLSALATTDTSWGDFYRSRASHFAHLQVVAEEHHGVPVPGVQQETQLRAALEAGDFAKIKRLTEDIGKESDRNAPGRIRVAAPGESRAHVLASPYPPGAVGGARHLGLVEESVASAAAFNTYLSCACGERPSFPEAPLSEANRVSRGCTCGHACPVEIGPLLRRSLDWLLMHPFMSSVGTRYLPWFGAETLLVETFPETEPDAQTPLLRTLSLPSRRGLSRMTIEDALRSRGPLVCADLGLDPSEFVLGCIPFDVYLRVAAHYGWGQQHLWTHFDGYQLMEDPRLTALALVGGDVEYGGADDLCAVQRDYEAERITARFCIVRRARFLARESQAGPSVSRR
jgi:hypothetical protein